MTTLHVVGLPWTETTREYLTCAYTQKLVKFGAMMGPTPYRVVLYSGVENETPCDEHVPLYEEGERAAYFGDHDQNTVWERITWDPGAEPWVVWNGRARRAIAERAGPNDFLLLVAGHAQAPLFGVPGMIATEPFVGYYGIATDFCAFESLAWRHHVYGNAQIQNGRWYDTVIPNYFDPSEFAIREKDDYLLFVGRITALKGPNVAAELAAAAGRRLLVAGPGAREIRRLPGGGVTIIGDGVEFGGKHVEYVGPVDVAARKDLMGSAAALIAPTLYIEPFGGVVVEAMLSGTPVVSSDWGGFTESVVSGKTGERFSILAEGVRALDRALDLNPASIRRYAIGRYSLKAVRPQFEAWYDRLSTLWQNGWYAGTELPAKPPPPPRRARRAAAKAR